MPLYPGVGHSGPVNTETSDLFWQGGQHLIAATHGRGMYRARPLVVVHVDNTNAGPEDGTFEHPYATLEKAVLFCQPGSVIAMKGGSYFEAEITIGVSSTLRVVGGVVVIE